MTALVAGVASSSRTVEAVFDAPVSLGPSAGAMLIPRSVPAVQCAAIALEPDGSTASILLDTEMSPGAAYELVLVDVLDAAGQPIPESDLRTPLVGFRPKQPRGRRFDLWSMLPRINRENDVTGDLRRLLDCFQDVFDLALADIDRFRDIFDPARCPEAYLDLILWDRGNPFSFPMAQDEKRRLAAVLGDMYEWKGTDAGIENTIRFFLGTEASVVPYGDEALILGESELGVDWILGASSEFARYAFDVEVDRTLTGDERAKLRSIVRFLKPAPTHFVRLIEPLPPPTFEHWELGVSLLGESTILH